MVPETHKHDLPLWIYSRMHAQSQCMSTVVLKQIAAGWEKNHAGQFQRQVHLVSSLPITLSIRVWLRAGAFGSLIFFHFPFFLQTVDHG